MPFNGLLKSIGPGMQMDGLMSMIQREFNELFMRIDKIEKSLDVLSKRVRIPGDEYWGGQMEQLQVGQTRKLTIEEFKAMFGGQKNADEYVKNLASLARPEKMNDEEFLQTFFGGPVKENAVPDAHPGVIVKEEKKEELHPAHSTSFVLKI